MKCTSCCVSLMILIPCSIFFEPCVDDEINIRESKRGIESCEGWIDGRKGHSYWKWTKRYQYLDPRLVYSLTDRVATAICTFRRKCRLSCRSLTTVICAGYPYYVLCFLLRFRMIEFLQQMRPQISRSPSKIICRMQKPRYSLIRSFLQWGYSSSLASTWYLPLFTLAK